ncbi:hypothetical protein [Aneurinibacillus migulanus]|nr:hypothetical protein [Aneurinibacillus migulanus]
MWINRHRLPEEILEYKVDRERQKFFCIAAEMIAEEDMKRAMRT